MVLRRSAGRAPGLRPRFVVASLSHLSQYVWTKCPFTRIGKRAVQKVSALFVDSRRYRILRPLINCDRDITVSYLQYTVRRKSGTVLIRHPSAGSLDSKGTCSAVGRQGNAVLF
jgi:hypothetical protein